MAQIQIQNLVQPKFINGDWRQPTLTLKGKKWCAPPIVAKYLAVPKSSKLSRTCPKVFGNVRMLSHCCLKVASKVPKLSQSYPKAVPKCSQSCLNFVSQLFKSCPNVFSMLSRNFLKVVQKWCECCSKVLKSQSYTVARMLLYNAMLLLMTIVICKSGWVLGMD